MLYTSILYLPGIPLMTHSFSQVYKRIISCYPIYNKIEFQKKNNDFLNLKKKLGTDILHPVKYLMPNVSTFSKLTQLVRLEWLHYTEHYTCCHLTQGSAQVYASELGAEVLSLSTWKQFVCHNDTVTLSVICDHHFCESCENENVLTSDLHSMKRKMIFPHHAVILLFSSGWFLAPSGAQ